MSTRAAIIQKQESGVYRGIYCHYDGYPSWVGKRLALHYNTVEMVNKLMDLGHISSLGKLVEPLPNDTKHSFDTPSTDVTVAYHRDRGEKDVGAVIGSSFEAVVDMIEHSYAYLYTDGKWYIGQSEDNLLPIMVSDEVDEDIVKNIDKLIKDNRLYINTAAGSNSPCISIKVGEVPEPRTDPAWQLSNEYDTVDNIVHFHNEEPVLEG